METCAREALPGRVSTNRLAWTTAVISLALVVIVPAAGAAGSKPRKNTHLGAGSGLIVNIQTRNLPADNTSYSFYYDRNTSPSATPFAVPDKVSFVITDIIVRPQSFTFSSSEKYVVVLEAGCCRSFNAVFTGATTQPYHLSGGLVVPAGQTLTARNTTLSDAAAEVQVLGYFVKGPGLGMYKSPF